MNELLRERIKHALSVGQIVLLPISIAIAPGPAAKVCLTVATILFGTRLYLETLMDRRDPRNREQERTEKTGE